MTDEQTLLQQAQGGDFDAFWQLVEPLQERIYRTVLRLVDDRDEAQDVVQEAFLRAMRSLNGFRGESRFTTWMFSIALNLARNRWRKNRRSQSLNWEDVIPAGSHSHGDHIDTDHRLIEWDDPHKLLSRKELGAVLDDAIAALPPKYRSVFLLRDIEELSVRQIAQALKLSETAVKSRIVRARLSMRKFLAPYLAKKEVINARLPQNAR